MELREEDFEKRPGYLVETYDGKRGRTYIDKPLVDGKVCVFLLKEDTKKEFVHKNGYQVTEVEHDQEATLYSPENLKTIIHIR